MRYSDPAFSASQSDGRTEGAELLLNVKIELSRLSCGGRITVQK